MPSLDFEAEKAALRDYYNDNATRLDQAREAFLTLLSSLLARRDHEIEPMGEFVRRHFNVIEVSDKTAEIEGTENSFGFRGPRALRVSRKPPRLGTRCVGLPTLMATGGDMANTSTATTRIVRSRNNMSLKPSDSFAPRDRDFD
jgi:hypothetical protein